jgi:hypothetical protein
MSAGDANASTQAVTNASSAESSRAGVAIAQNNSLPNAQLQTPSTNFAGTQTLLDQVTAAANTARQRFTDRITQGTEAIAASIQQQQAALIAAGEQQTGAIQALFANARTQVGEIITSAQAQLQTDATSHLASLEQGHTATLGQVETTFASGQERVQNLGNTYAERSLQTADDSAEQVQTRIQGMAQESQAIGQEKAQVGGSTPEIAQAKAKAANEIASDTATKITSGVSDAMRDLRATGPETARGFKEQSQEAARQVGAGQAEAVNQLNTSNQQTASGIQQAVTQGSQALGNLGTQLTGQLASLEQTIQNQLQTQIAQKSQEIYQAGQQAITTFQQQGQQAIASGDEQLAQFNQQLAGMDVKPELVAEVTGEIVSQVNGAYDNLIATTDGAFQQADGALTQAGTEVINAINAISTNAAGQIQTFLGQAQGQVNQQVSSISGQLGSTVTEANTAGSGMVSQVATSLDGQIGQIDSSFGQGLEQYQGALDEQVTSAEEKAREPRESLSGRVDQGQHKAEERARHSLLDDPLGWIGDQLSDLWDMLSDPGFWVGLLVGVALALVVVAAVAAAPFTGGASIALLIGGMALAGGLAAAAGTIVSNITNHSFSNLFSGNLDWSRWSENLGTSILIGALFGAGLAAAELLGAGLIALSITAGVFTVITNVATGQPWDKSLLANMLLVGVLSKLFRLARGRSPVGEEPPVRPPSEEPPVPSEEPPVPSEEPPVPSEEPPVPSEEPPVPSEEPPVPSEEPQYNPAERTPGELVGDTDQTPRSGETQEQANERARAASEEQAERGYCFVAGTLVQTPDGPLAIETLAPGQLVLAKGEDQPVGTYPVIDCSRGSTITLFHVEIADKFTLTTTGKHPFFVIGKGWTMAKALVVGDNLISLDGLVVPVTAINRERLNEPVTTFNIHVEDAHSYFVGQALAVWVHNGNPNDPAFGQRLIWGFGASGPRQRLPDPAKGSQGDLDGASAWRTGSADEAARFLGARATEGGTGNHGAITEAQLASQGLVAVETPGHGAAADAGLQHVSIRPATNPDPSVDLTEAEMLEVKAKLEALQPVAKAKPKDFGCG